MKNIYLVRHGETVSNAGGVAIRNPEIPLTEKGEQQSCEVANWVFENISPIDSIFVSTFIRTHQTARPLVEKTGLSPIIIEGLQEFNYISFEHIDGVSANIRRQLATEYWQKATPDFIDGNDAESFAHLQERITDVIAYFECLPNGNHIVYTHGLWLSMLLWRYLNLAVQSNDDMQCFRQFEQAVKIKNSEVFLLQLAGNCVPAITKVRELLS